MTSRSDQAVTRSDYRQLFHYTDQLLLWLADRDPVAYQRWAPIFADLDGPDAGPSDHVLYERLCAEVGPLGRPSRLVHFVTEPERAARWWHEHMHPSGWLFDEDGYWGITLDVCELGFHPADGTDNPASASPVAYWPVVHLDAKRAQLIEAGCTALRAPLDREPERNICQLVDPHGIAFGLEEPR